MKKNERTLALIGCGRWGKNLARNLHQLSVLHTICDKHTEHPTYPGVAIEPNYRTLLENKEITQVVIATPAETHYALAKEALQAGKDVFVEKPLALSVVEGEELVQLAEEKSLILMVGHLLHYHPCVQRVKQIIHSGTLGEIQYISSHRTFPGALRSENVLWDLAPHDISVILSLTESSLSPTISATATTANPQGIIDTATILLQFESGLSAHIHTSWAYPFKEQKMTIIGTQGALVFDDVQPWEKKVSLYLKENTDDKISYESSSVHVPEGEPLYLECRHFIKCCESRSEPVSNGREALMGIRVLQDVQLNIFRKQELVSLT